MEVKEMKIVDQCWEWLQKPCKPLELIERAGRTCYKSEDKISQGSALKFVQMLKNSGHESVIEHAVASVRFVTNRGVTHELVRHRLASFSQESTRYVNYYMDMEFIKPVWWDDSTAKAKRMFKNSCLLCERNYLSLLSYGWRPEQAREVLPNSLKTEIVMTANLREWMHVFNLRCSKKAHPQMRELMISCREGFRKEIPILFD